MSFKRQVWPALILTTLIFAGFATLPIPLWLAYLGAINLVTLGFYGWDKWRAIKQKSRTPEWCLHLLALLGGSPGAWVAQQFFRHKTIKRSFRIVFWTIVALQIITWILWWRYLQSH
jgi:uncharacterized membrane protein YsdA (DUF1294 family)